MRPIVTSVKHYVQVTLSSVSNGAVNIEFIAVAKDLQAVDDPNEVVEGSVVKAIYVEFWIQQSSTAVGSFVAGVYKNPGGENTLTTAEAIALHDWNNKKNVFYTTMGLSPGNEEQIHNVVRGWIKIPKGKQRMGLGDQLNFFLRNNNATEDINYCGFATYKEYR